MSRGGVHRAARRHADRRLSRRCSGPFGRSLARAPVDRRRGWPCSAAPLAASPLALLRSPRPRRRPPARRSRSVADARGLPGPPGRQPVEPARRPAAGGGELGARRSPRSGWTRRCTRTSGPSTPAPPTGSRTRWSSASTKRVPVRFNYASESDRGPYPIPPNAPIEGGRNGSGRPPRDRRRPGHLHRLRALRRPPGRRRATAGRPARAPSSTCALTACGRPAGPRPTPPGCRSCPAWRATPRSRRARSTTRCGSPRPARPPATCIRPGTRRAPATTRTPRRWDCGSG